MNRDRNDRSGVQVHRVLWLGRQMRSAILHLGDLRLGITQGYIHELDNARDLMVALSRTNKSPRTRSSRPRADLVAV